MNIIICDDEALFRSSIEEKILQWAHKNSHRNSVITHLFSSGEDLLDAWEHGLQVDAVFLDIQIPGEMNGVAVAKEIYCKNEYVPIVFVTGYGEYAEEGYVVNALRYLRKPVSERSIAECMNIIWRRWESQHNNCVLLDLPSQIIRLPVNNILYVEVRGHYCIIKTTDHAEEYKIKQQLEYIRKRFPKNLFVQCHRSYIINLMYVRHISHGQISMADSTIIQMGRVYQPQFMKLFREYHLNGGE